MAIEEESKNKMSFRITAARGNWILALFFAVMMAACGIILLYQGHVPAGAVLLGGSLPLGLHSLGKATYGGKMTLESDLQSLIIEERHLFFIFKRRNIPFSSVLTVSIDSVQLYRPFGSSWSHLEKGWRV